jgi:hypothetical protein
MSALFAVVAIEHPGLRDVREDCAECLACAESAAIVARVTGSRGSTYDDRGHSATVKRAIRVINLDAKEE